ncbi:Glycosyl transferase [Parasponia andersonii]|uniref:Glycosyl transferase n=1 Tax=Parasponia andersonii TaxID=3476 RepID=A0A2P5DH27_PARAD|nr:Glycosyl transferase [Parasponia andersonii]
MTLICLPTATVSNNDALSLAAHRLGMVGRGHKKHRIRYGVLLNIGLILFLTVLLLYVDGCAWRIVRLPLAPFYLTRSPFSPISHTGLLCWLCLRPFTLWVEDVSKGPARHSVKRRTPTMGGLFFVPVGVLVAKYITGFSSTEMFWLHKKITNQALTDMFRFFRIQVQKIIIFKSVRLIEFDFTWLVLVEFSKATRASKEFLKTLAFSLFLAASKPW